MLGGTVDLTVPGVVLGGGLMRVSIRVTKAIDWGIGNLILRILPSGGAIRGRLLCRSLPIVRVLVGVCHSCYCGLFLVQPSCFHLFLDISAPFCTSSLRALLITVCGDYW
jgi:hypothetical protein